jgi:HK97 family phage portal protein
MRIFGYEIRTKRIPRPSPDSDFWFEHTPYGTSSGVDVTEDSAMRSATVWSCVKVISEDMASMPLIVYRREGKSKERAVEHPLYQLLHDRPNPEMTSMQWRECQQLSLLLWGNAYSEIQRNLAGEPMALWPLDPSKMTVDRDKATNELVYKYAISEGGTRTFSKEEILHIAGLSYNGLIGLGVIAFQRESIGTCIAGSQYQGSAMANSGMSTVCLSHPAPKAPSPEGRKAFREELQKTYAGPSNAGKWIVLWEGMKAESISLSPADMQFIDSRKYTQIDICGIYRIPPHKIGILDRATFSNIEQQSISYVVDCLRPWCIRWEQQINMKLLGKTEEYYVEHLVDGMLRGDLPSRYAAYATGRQWGWLSVNDVRSIENMNPVPNGDEYIVPMNMAPAGEPPPKPENQGDNIVAVGGRK